ncbi:MAG: S-methyl-5-thioribose-1-phosphate isomerase [Chloroflexi bacterium]|nr:S-methyl-5-thioribose-1-phosphate isomerase [Chloroflexota bacterium]
MRTVAWYQGRVRMVDQRRIPHSLEFLDFDEYHQVAQAIQEMVVRGAPAIGAAGALGLALAAQNSTATTREGLVQDVERAAKELRAARPTAVNLSWGLDRLLAVIRDARLQTPGEMREAILQEALQLVEEDVIINQRMGRFGAALIPDGATILHHCNTGGLAAVDYGTALGVIRTAHEEGKRIHVLVDETRPRLQGARLTAWELMQWGIPMTLIVDNAAASMMQQGKVTLVAVGADRIAANGDTANKIGTYMLAVLAASHQLPFYVVAPTSTIDLNLPTGREIPIEERDPREVTYIENMPIGPEGVRVANPAFDVTPARYISAIVTEEGVVRPPYEDHLREAVLKARQKRT